MNLFEYFSRIDSVKNILSKDKYRIAGSCDNYNLMLIATDFYLGDKSLFVVLPNIYQAQKYYDALASFMNEEDVLFFPADELVSAEMISATGDFLFERIQTIYILLQNNKKIIVTNMHGAIKYEMNPSIWRNNIFTLNINDSIDIDDLCDQLIKLGYEPCYQTVKTGHFSKRGSIVDIFPLGYSNPIRLDFFGDDIDSIKEFNIETQRSSNSINSVNILPVTEFIYSSEDYELGKSKILAFMDNYKLSEIEESNLKRDLLDLESHKSLDTLSRYIEFFDDNLVNVFDFCQNKKIYIVDPGKAKELFNNLVLDLNDYCGRVGGYSIANMKMFNQFDLILSKANIQIEGLRSISNIDYNCYAKEIIPYKANQKAIMNDLKAYKDRKKLLICLKSEERYKKLNELVMENNSFINRIDDLNKIRFGQINLIMGDYPCFDLLYEDFIILNEASIFEVEYAPRRVKYKSIYKNAIKISKYDELCIGDYVVHYDYGIGKYLGIKTLKNNDIERDYIFVQYAKNTSLYIPLEKISNIMKYASGDVEGVILHEIGGTAWARTKAKVRSKVRDISDKLVSLYAARSQAKGFAFEADTLEQAEFESEFEYELTQDQKKAIDSVKSDMESPRPMDRLVCGDVGYGKTEVAMRAAFKAVYGGKQVCVLAPTTILARQHYLNFKNRMEKYAIRVELLSRFVSPKNQRAIIEDLEHGGVDIVVGTHRVLSDEIKYHDLGLLIVDEEQRFGVTHKEKIKELKVNVDCITLTATPIPRTLQMSMMGIKDLSMIETPPKNRYPVQTYVLERNDRIIADAIEREMARDGQVFYLYNFVDGIEEIARHINTLVPDARIAVGHGKLSKDQLENIITKFINKEYDVLLCTTIIETGIDMPDTNTLIIHDADRLGLSQMYQIRGRVGRSNKIAYAYLMYEPRKVLTKEAEKRLETIKEFNELGSGFKIAMRDLSIRGAGDLLGAEQSGFVESVGIDIYLKILDEEINKKTIEEPKKEDASLVTPMVNRRISEEYINNDDTRIAIHKKIDKLTSIKDMNDLIAELEDRFGTVDEELMLYMYEKIIKTSCNKLGIYKIDKTNKRYLTFIFSQDASKKMDGTKLFVNASKFKFISLTYKNMEIQLLLEIQGRNKIDYFKDICEYFNLIA